MTWNAPSPPAPPSDAPKPANPEPTAAPVSPEKHGVHDPEQGKSEHPKQ
jgi:heme-binding NEAT domain protein